MMKTNLFFAFIFLISHLAFGQWTQQGLDIDGEAANDWSGQSVSLSADGNIVAIGAYSNDGNGNNSGHVRVYQFQSGSWVQLGADIDGEVAGDSSGESVSLSADGSIVAIGATNNDGNGNNSGHVRVYQFQSGSWVQLGADIDGETAEDSSGRSISLSADGNRIAVGAFLNDGNGNDSGHARVYEYQSGNWVQIGADIDGEAAEDRSGYSVSLSADGSIVAIGAFLNDGNGNDSGHVRVYEFQGGSWVQLGADIDGEAASDGSGASVSLSADGNRVAIGAWLNDGNGNDSGHVRVYRFNGANWIQLGGDIDGETADDRSGTSISLGADGSTVAIGARYNDGNGNNSGHVRVYRLNGANWVQKGADMDGEAAFDGSGWSVSLSGNNNLVAIGAFLNDGNGVSSGHVRIYTAYTAIPDANFEQALIDQNIDSEGILDGQVLTADIVGITYLDVFNQNITDLTGIEVFAALETLRCHNNQLTSLDISQNTNLTTLWCNDNQLASLDISQNLILETLYCSDNQLTGLDVSQHINLTTLSLGSNQFTDLDVSQNINLTTLSLDNNQFTDLDVSQNTNLTSLSLGNNQLTSLDISQNINLTSLSCSNNQLTNLDISQNTGLTSLLCHNNPLASLDVSQNTNLTTLWCFNNQLTNLDISQNTGLTFLLCHNNQLASLDLSQNTNLTYLRCDNNQLTNLDVSQNTGLTVLDCQNNPLAGGLVLSGLNGLTFFNATNTPNLLCIQVDDEAAANAGTGIYENWIKDATASYSESCYTAIPDANFEQALIAYDDIPGDHQILTAGISGITTLDVSGQNIADLTGIEDFMALDTLHCHDNQLTSLNISQNTNLTTLWCFNNQLASLDVSQNAGLTELRCYDNPLGNLNVSQNTGLTHLNCSFNQLTSLDVSQNTGLTELYCFNNQLGSLDLSQNTSLTALSCFNNPLAGSLILSGLNALTSFNATNTPNLLCIQVDDEAAANAGTGIYAAWSKDLTASYSETCYTAIPDANFEAILGTLGYDDISADQQVPTANIYRITTLNVSGQNIADLTGIEGFTALQSLYCNSNQLTSLDLSQNINLAVVWCYNNQIGSLDVSQNPMLTTLLCQNNSLTGLNVSQNLILTSLQCHTNPNLSCIEVDNATDANAGSGIYAGWIKDNTAIYSENCGGMAKGTIVSTVKDQGIPEEAPLVASDIKLYPNPVRDNVHLTLPAGKELLNATVYNTNGQQVAASKTNRISLKKLPAGIYFVILQFSDGERITKKVIISRE